MRPVLATPQFLKDYRKASAVMANAVEHEVQSLVRRMEAMPDTWIRAFDRVASIEEKVIEVDLGGGPRLLAHVNGSVTLWRMGGHDITDIVRRFDPSHIASAVPVPPQFLPARTSHPLGENAGDDIESYKTELFSEWVHFLDDPQAEAGEALLEGIEQALVAEEDYTGLVLGGPGTGKTTVLLWLLKHLTNVDAASGESWDVRLMISKPMRRFIEASTGWDLEARIAPISTESPADVVLVDDPSSVGQLDRLAQLQAVGAGGRGCHVVLRSLSDCEGRQTSTRGRRPAAPPYPSGRVARL